MDSRIVILIPAYRPTSALLDTVAGIYAQDGGGLIGSTVVIDDGSGPEFARLFAQLERMPEVTVVRHAVNLGKGAALKTGFNHALVHWPEAAGVVTADADGQHAVADILSVAGRLAANPDHLVLGVRAFVGDVPLRSRIGNQITRWVFRAFTGMRVLDTQTGLRGWPRAYCMASLPIPINGYDFELECLLRAKHRSGQAVPIAQVPIRTIYQDSNAASHFNPIRDSTRIYFVFLRYCGASVLAALIDSGVFSAVYAATSHMALSQLAGRALAVAVAFLIARNIVFRSDTSILRSLAKYLGLVTLMGFVSYAFIRYLNLRFGFPVLGAKLTAEGLLFVANFTIQRELVFVRSKLGREENGG
jgi:putative flippase GtrA